MIIRVLRRWYHLILFYSLTVLVSLIQYMVADSRHSTSEWKYGRPVENDIVHIYNTNRCHTNSGPSPCSAIGEECVRKFIRFRVLTVIIPLRSFNFRSYLNNESYCTELKGNHAYEITCYKYTGAGLDAFIDNVITRILLILF